MSQRFLRQRAGVAIFLFLSSSCASSGFDDSLFAGLCVAEEAGCMKSCRELYRDHDDRWGYQTCLSQCQPGGVSDC